MAKSAQQREKNISRLYKLLVCLALLGCSDMPTEKQKVAKSFIESLESVRLVAYKDTKGRYSIGYGTKSYRGEKITLATADKRFNRYLEKNVWGKVPNSLSANQYAVYSSLVYNLPGHAKDMLVKQNWVIRLFTGRKYKLDCKNILTYRKADGKINEGVIKRRQQEYELCVM